MINCPTLSGFARLAQSTPLAGPQNASTAPQADTPRMSLQLPTSCARTLPTRRRRVNPTVVAGEVMLVPLTLKGMNMPLNGSVDFGPDWVTFRANTNIILSIQPNLHKRNTNSGDYFVGSDGIPKGRIKFDAAEVWSVSISIPGRKAFLRFSF